MSLCDDMNMYYRDSYLGYELEDGSIAPFYIDSISTSWDEGEWDEEEEEYVNEEDTYAAEAYDHLTFHGTLIVNSAGASERISLNGFNNAKLVKDNPDIGFVRIPTPFRGGRDRLIWISYTPQRSVKKGLTSRRITYNGRITNTLAWSLFNSHITDRYHANLALDQDRLFYKEVCIGTHADGILTIEPEASYLVDFITKESKCQVVMKP